MRFRERVSTFNGAAMLLAISFAPAGCQSVGSFGVYNNTRETLVLHINTIMAEGLKTTKTVRPSRMMFASVVQLPRDEDGTDVLRVSTGRCQLIYRFDGTEAYAPAGPGPAVRRDFPLVQIEPDFTVYMRPVGAKGAIPVEALMSATLDGKPLQRGPFPLRPTEKTCR